MDKEKILDDIASTQRHYIMTLRGFPAAGFNTRPAPDKWSAGDIGEHVSIAEEFFLPVLTGPGKPTAGCDLDKRVAVLRTIFIEQDKKYVAPERVRPTEAPKDVESLVVRIQQSRSVLSGAVSRFDLTETAMAFTHPMLGDLTRGEWIYAIIFHGERHRLQIESLKKTM
jgi:hypothetical protein